MQDWGHVCDEGPDKDGEVHVQFDDGGVKQWIDVTSDWLSRRSADDRRRAIRRREAHAHAQERWTRCEPRGVPELAKSGCFKCGAEDHWARECPQGDGDDRRGGSRRDSGNDDRGREEPRGTARARAEEASERIERRRREREESRSRGRDDSRGRGRSDSRGRD